MLESFASPALLVLVGLATVTDIRQRRVPLWLTVGGGLAGLGAAVVQGWQALAPSLLGLIVGAALLLPFVRAGGFGGGDALLLAAVGAWRGGEFVLLTACWASLAGGALALLALARRERTFPYVPAIAVGVGLALAQQHVWESEALRWIGG